MAGKHCKPFCLWQIRSDATLQNGRLDQPGDVLIGEAGLEGTFAIP